MITKTKPPTLLGKPVVLDDGDTCFVSIGSVKITFVKWKNGIFQTHVGQDWKNHRTLPAAVRWAEKRILATAKALDKARGKQ
jgi:hypothetical protein